MAISSEKVMSDVAKHDNETISKPHSFTNGSDSVKLSADEKFHIITQNLQEVLGATILKEYLESRDISIYWGTAITGKPHVAYFLPMCKVADFLRAGCQVTILFADLHGFLDNMKAPWEMLSYRMQYYEFVIKGILKSLGVSLARLKFIHGTDYQLSREYTLDVYKMASLVTEHDAKKAGAEVVKQIASPLLSGLLYPVLQTLDEEYLKVDAQFGGVDQRKIFTFAEKYLPKLNYKQRIHLMNPMVPGLTGDKMSASDPDSKIDILDFPQIVKKKLEKAFCIEGDKNNNGILAFTQYVLFSVINGDFVIDRSEKYGGNLVYSDYQTLENDFIAKNIHPQDLKSAVAKYLNQLLDPIRAEFHNSPALQKLRATAYPDEEPVIEEAKAPKTAKPKGGANKLPQELDISRLDLRVGVILTVEDHPNADTLYVETIDIGDEQPRTVVSGFKGLISPDNLIGKKVILLCNVKPANTRGVISEAILLAATHTSKGTEEACKKVELLNPHFEGKPGDRVYIENCQRDTFEQINAKFWEKVKLDLKTNSECEATYKCSTFQTNKGVVKVDTLANSIIM